MNENTLFKRLKEILSDIDKDQYPQTYEYIVFDIDEEEEIVYEDAYEVACGLHECDEVEVMYYRVAELVIDIYLEEIKNENPVAMTNLGSLYYTGRCGEQNYEKAVKYYMMADKHGERQATENLGYCYYYGRTGDVDYKKAYHYFVKGALNNQLTSLYKIGDMYKNGYYVEKDETEAFHIYNHCYNQMEKTDAEFVGADICMRMGNVYYYGIGTEKDYQLALKFYQEAERYFYKKIQSGDYFARKGLKDVIKKQDEIRKVFLQELPEFAWTKE